MAHTILWRKNRLNQDHTAGKLGLRTNLYRPQTILLPQVLPTQAFTFRPQHFFLGFRKALGA